MKEEKPWYKKATTYLLGILVFLTMLFSARRNRSIKQYDDTEHDEKTASLEERQEEIKRQQREFDLNVENPGTHPDIEGAVRDWNEGNKDGKN